MTRLANKSLCFTTVSPTMDIHVNSVEPKKKKKKVGMQSIDIF
jgi:hypothetical protein